MFSSHKSDQYEPGSGAGKTASSGHTGDNESFTVLGRRIELLQEEIQRTARITPCYNESTDEGDSSEEAQFVPTIDSLRARKEKLATTVQELSETINDENHEYSTEYLQGFADWRSLQTHCEILIDLAQLFTLLLEFRHNLQHDRFATCAIAYLECCELLKKFDARYEHDSVTGTFQAAEFLLSQHKVALRESARVAFQSMVQVHRNGHELEQSMGIKAGSTPCILVDEAGCYNQQSHPVKISEVIVALTATRSLEEELHNISSATVASFAEGILRGKLSCQNISVPDIRWDEQCTRRILVSKPLNDDKVGEENFAQEQLYSLLRFLCTTVITPLEGFPRLQTELQVHPSIFGDCLWWGNQDAYMSPPWLSSRFPKDEGLVSILIWKILESLPADPVETPSAARAFAEEFSALENRVMSSRFVESDRCFKNLPHWSRDMLKGIREMREQDTSWDGRQTLKTICSDISALHCYKFRSQYLARARHLCVQEYHNSRRVEPRHEGNQDKIFPFPVCHISETAIAVEELVHQIMSKLLCVATDSGEAQNGSLRDRVCRMLLRAARDCFDMFRAVVSAKFADAISQSPRLSMLFHNDCLYLSNQTLAIGFEYRKKLPDPYCRLVVFVDMVPLLRDIAERTYCNQLRVARERIHEALDKLPTLSDLNDSDLYSETESVLTSCLRRINDFVRNLGNVLPYELHVQTTAHLLDTALFRLLKAVIQMEIIPPPLKWSLTELLDKLKSGVRLERQAEKSQESAAEVTLYSASQYLRKAELLIFFLKVGKDDLIREENQGELKKYFDESELVKLIRSCYCDSPRVQRELIDVFTSGS
eukprot:gb/GECG01014757.1/.p1 GENE.gb/GECG01014757.1/~~gb/GECG01014757.1/.p1  ORF type:complete len:826 (+),score=83.37 gb/GECG01014757.1/:1-2478(+)